MTIILSKSAMSLPIHAIPPFQLLQSGDGESAGRCLEAILLGLAGLTGILLLGSQAMVQLLTPHTHLPLRGIVLLLLLLLSRFGLALRLGLWLGTGLMQLEGGGELELELVGLRDGGVTSEERREAALRAAMRWDCLRGVDMACN